MLLTTDEAQSLLYAKQYLDNSVPERTNNRDLARLAGLSQKKLGRGFKFLYKVTIYQYWLGKSMAFAKAMMEDGAQVKEVSRLLRYSTTGSFSRAFRVVYKISPTEIKRQ
jgi:AraC-like DNA-binding protein